MMCHLLLAPILVLAAAATPVPVILDTDLGDDIDDTWALAMLLGTPQVDVKLIVTATSDTERKTRLVAKILEQMGRTDIPIGTGVRENDEKTHQDAWLGNTRWINTRAWFTPTVSARWSIPSRRRPCPSPCA